MTAFGRTKIVVAGDKRESLEDEELWDVLSREGFNNGTSLDSVGFYKDLQADKLVALLPKAFAKIAAKEKNSGSSHTPWSKSTD